MLITPIALVTLALQTPALTSCVVGIGSADPICFTHVKSVLAKHKLTMTWAGSSLDVVFRVNAIEDEVAAILNLEAPSSRFSLSIGSRKANSFLPIEQWCHLDSTELAGKGRAPFDVGHLCQSQKIRLEELKDIAYIPCCYLDQDFKYHVAFDLLITFTSGIARGAILRADDMPTYKFVHL